MKKNFDQGFFAHTSTARPYWAGDVGVTSWGPAPGLHGRNAGPSLHGAVSKVLSIFAKR